MRQRYDLTIPVNFLTSGSRQIVKLTLPVFLIVVNHPSAVPSSQGPTVISLEGLLGATVSWGTGPVNALRTRPG